jgi:hypothetical protein
MGITECNGSREWLSFQELGFWSNFTIPHSTLYREPRDSIFILELEELFFLRQKHLDAKREY